LPRGVYTSTQQLLLGLNLTSPMKPSWTFQRVSLMCANIITHSCPYAPTQPPKPADAKLSFKMGKYLPTLPLAQPLLYLTQSPGYS
ncbi:mCG145488, partial [Mus musculus]